MDAAPVCAACHTPLQRGVTLDRGYNDRYHVSEWVEGVPEPGFWQGGFRLSILGGAGNDRAAAHNGISAPCPKATSSRT